MFSTFVTALMILSASDVGLTGKVVDQDNQPIANVVVSIHTARPRSGPAMICPSCYLDCAKRFVTKGDGTFKFENISDKLLFSLVAGATGYQGAATSHYDPVLEDEIKIQLIKQPEASQSMSLRGKVVDPNGKPIPGAHISIEEVRLDNGNGFGGARDKITPLTITDEEGNFKLIANEPLKSVRIRVLSPGFSPEEITWSPKDKRDVIAKLGLGANISGRLLRNGKPLAETTVGIIQEIRFVGNIVTPMDVTTDREGRFLFEHVPPNREYSIYTHTGQSAHGVLPVSLVTIPGHAKLVDLGDIETVEPRKLTVVVHTEDGSSIPDKSGIYIGRQEAWNSTNFTLENQKESTVSLDDVGPELFYVGFRIPGYDVISSEPRIEPDLNRRYQIRIEKDCVLRFTVAPNKASRK